VHVTGDDLRAYIEVFHQSLAATAARHLPPKADGALLRHAGLLPARISAHVSSQFGLAIEYERAATTSIQVHEGSDRVEDLLLRAPAWTREVAPMFTIDGPNHSLRKRPLTRGFPFRLTTERASLTLEDVTIQLGPWKRSILYAEIYGSLDDTDWTVEKAHARARDEVLLAAFRLSQAGARQLPVAQYLEQFHDKLVLVLGDEHAEGRDRLAAVAAELRAFNYEPVLPWELPSQPAHSPADAVLVLGAAARFVFVDGDAAPLATEVCRDRGWLGVTLDAGDPAAAVLPALRHAEALREEVEGRMRG
jgi:hypothetical protein